MTRTVTLVALNGLPGPDFVALLGGIFEHSPWVAERAAGRRPFASRALLHAAMVAEVEDAGVELQLALIRAHPELAGKAAIRGEVSADSATEQAGAGLDQCSPEEFRALTQLNADYNARFGFPFILAVRGYDRQGIIAEFARRAVAPVEDERGECLRQIYRIAEFRLTDLVTE